MLKYKWFHLNICKTVNKYFEVYFYKYVYECILYIGEFSALGCYGSGDFLHIISWLFREHQVYALTAA